MMAIFPMGLSVRLFKVKTIIIHILALSPYTIPGGCQALFYTFSQSVMNLIISE